MPRSSRARAFAHEVGDRKAGGPDRVGGAPVRAHRVRIALGHLEQRRERLEAVGDLGVVHRPQSSAWTEDRGRRNGLDDRR